MPIVFDPTTRMFLDIPDPMPSHQPTSEVTLLTPAEERAFQAWVRANPGIQNLDMPDTFYDYRGYWKDIASKGRNESGISPVDGLLHFVDTYKQHGHPTFSAESQYSRGLWDGGQWIGETLVAPPVKSHKGSK